MKQKVVIKVTMNCQKCRTKAFKIAVSILGVESAAIRGEDKIEVTGDGVDAVVLATLLRKKFGFAELVSVATEEAKPEGKPPESKPKPQPQPQPQLISCIMPPPIYEFTDTWQFPCHDPNNNCSIL